MTFSSLTPIFISSELQTFLLSSSSVFYQSVCLPHREAITGGLTALRRVIPGGDTFMNLGLEMVSQGLKIQHTGKTSPSHTGLVSTIRFHSGKYPMKIN